MKRILLTGALFTAGLGIYGEAKAACRIYDYEKNDVLMAVGRVVVRPSDPVGAILRKATFPI
ncbi:fimbrial protein, partial [Acinetobacter baumannii]